MAYSTLGSLCVVAAAATAFCYLYSLWAVPSNKPDPGAPKKNPPNVEESLPEKSPRQSGPPQPTSLRNSLDIKCAPSGSDPPSTPKRPPGSQKGVSNPPSPPKRPPESLKGFRNPPNVAPFPCESVPPEPSSLRNSIGPKCAPSGSDPPSTPKRPPGSQKGVSNPPSPPKRPPGFRNLPNVAPSPCQSVPPEPSSLRNSIGPKFAPSGSDPPSTPKRPPGSQKGVSNPPSPPKRSPESLKGVSDLPTQPKRPPGPLKGISNQKSGLSVYAIPEHLKDLIERDRVPDVLRKPLSPSTYVDFFAALLYAEDYYLKKWSEFILKGVTLEFREEWTSGKSVLKNNKIERMEGEKKTYVVFEIETIPEKRPYLLSRDYVFLQPSGKEVNPFQGILTRVVKSKHVYTEFGDDFHSQHSATRKYDVSFSFNRVCLKRSHHAVAAAMDLSFQILFPKPVTRTNYLKPTSVFLSSHNFHQEEISATQQILNLKSPPPYLIEGPLSRTGLVIREAILQIYRTFPESRILVTSPKNSTCDYLLRSLKKEIPEQELFRANAAFRELEDVPDDILAWSTYEKNKECFTCPSLKDLKKFKVITSTFVSSFRLHNAGINAGHFTHIFLVDASNAIEPEVMVTLANLVDEKTAIVVTGCLGDSPERVRSDIARRKGLKRSYFLRLLNSEPYSSRNPMFVVHLLDAELDNSVSVSRDF
ncbi:putative RNA helicase SDE3 isoform X1 [Tasmannia lanceolata]|uniref:putative RNA helicase SDE3 isoform X1 n=1 Tax=Tasmannia lanceolata TaxID=3420 RepID=UPI004063266F